MRKKKLIQFCTIISFSGTVASFQLLDRNLLQWLSSKSQTSSGILISLNLFGLLMTLFLTRCFFFSRLHRVSEDAEKDIRAAIVEHWPAGLESKEAEETLGGARQYRLLEDPWTRSRRNDGTKRPMVAAQILASRVLLVLNRRELNLYARVCLRRGEPDQVTLLMFRQSNVAYTETLTIQPTGIITVAVINKHFFISISY